MTAPASAAPGAGDPRATGPSASALWSEFEEDAHAARLRGVPSGVLEDRGRLVRFVVSERGHVCSAQDPQAIRRPIGSRSRWANGYIVFFVGRRWRRTLRTSRYGLASAAAASATTPTRAASATR